MENLVLEDYVEFDILSYDVKNNCYKIGDLREPSVYIPDIQGKDTLVILSGGEASGCRLGYLVNIGGSYFLLSKCPRLNSSNEWCTPYDWVRSEDWIINLPYLECLEPFKETEEGHCYLCRIKFV